MWRRLDHEAELIEAWRTARPFPHVVVDDFVPPAELATLMARLEEEPVDRYEADLYVFEASAPEPASPELQALRAEFAEILAPALARITGRHTTRVDMRAYAYRPGHYLLPHVDHQAGLTRVLAYAYYLPSPEPPVGGELELYACRVESDELVEVTSAQRIEPRANRLVVFEVSPTSLHQVCEVLAGLRLSLSGWFHA